jgi:polar amino acid transport system substrate-binding protein
MIKLILLCVFLSASVFGSDFKTIQKNKKIRIAVDTTYPPMEFEAVDGKVTGLDVDWARELAKELKVEAEFIVMPWDGVLAGLKSDRYDIIMSSMNITPERSKEVNFVEYISMGQVFVVKNKNLIIKNEKDLNGKIVAVQADTTSSTAVLNFKKSGINIKEVLEFKGATEAFAALKSNHAEVIVIDEAVGKYFSKLDPKTFTITGNAILPLPIGIAVKKSAPALLKALQTALATIKKNGSFDSIYKKWTN